MKKLNKIYRTQKQEYYYNQREEKVVKIKAPIFAWHLVGQNKKLGYNDNRKVKPGKTYIVRHDHENKSNFNYWDWVSYNSPAQIVPCYRGLHASINVFDAYKYHQGPFLCRVQMGGWVSKGKNKLVATKRKVLWMIELNDELEDYLDGSRDETKKSNRVIFAEAKKMGIKNPK